MKLFVTGGAGFLGGALLRELAAAGHEDVIALGRDELDLCHARALDDALKVAKPDVIVHLAARVGGIGYNMANPASLYLDNLTMGTNVIEAARVHDAGLVLLGTVCSYPRVAPLPFSEESLWEGYPESTNAPYGIAKLATLVHAQVNYKQYGQRSAYLIPTNLYGPGDSFDPARSHVIPALIDKMLTAKDRGDDSVELWGTGCASREYLYVEDAAKAIVATLDHIGEPVPINLSGGGELTIAETAAAIAEATGFEGEIVWDTSKPDGQPRRAVSGARAAEVLSWQPQTPFVDGLRATVSWYLDN